MKVMKLGSKSDSLHYQANNIRYVAAELATDVVVSVGDVKFYLHKFPLLSKSTKLQTLILSTSNKDEIDISDIPGGPIGFEICVKFCYSFIFTLTPHNVAVARCAAEYLEMHENVEKGNFIYKIDVFLNSGIFHSWKDSINVLHSTTPLLPWVDEVNLTGQCVDSIASKCSVDVSSVTWSFSYNRDNIYKENENGKILAPKDWWVEDLCGLEVDLFKQVVFNIKIRGRVLDEIIGNALIMYTFWNLPGFGKGMNNFGDTSRAQSIIDMIVLLLPVNKGCVSCDFLLKLLKAAITVGSGECTKKRLVMGIGKQLEDASVHEIMISDGGTMRKIVEEFAIQNDHNKINEASQLKVVKLIDEYLTEIAKDTNLAGPEFIEIAEMASGFSRPCHDGIYRAIDMYLKEHPNISKSERKRICRLIDCKKLSFDACTHAIQNERLPLRVIVQILFFEQIKAPTSSSCNTTPYLPKGCNDSTSNSHTSSKSATTNTDDDLDGLTTTNELKALKAGVAALRLGKKRNDNGKRSLSKMKGLLVSKKVLSKMWPSKGHKNGFPEEAKFTNLRNRRHSVS